MHNVLTNEMTGLLAANALLSVWSALWPYVVIFAGFSSVIFVHELGHFMAAKWAGVKVERFAIGFFKEVIGFTWGETRYSFNILPLGGYVKMLGQEDFDDKSNELRFKDDPRSFVNIPVGKRMVIVSAGVVMNLIFAALMFVVVFMKGVEEPVTTIGQVLPESPAARAGLMPGDKVLRIAGHEIREYQEIRYAIVLADPHTPVEFEVERRGKVVPVTISPEPDQQQNLLHVGIMPATTNKVVAVVEDSSTNNASLVHPGDRIIAIEGRPLSEEELAGGLEQRLRSASGAPVRVTVERPDPDNPDAPPKKVDCVVNNMMIIDPSDPLDNDTRNVLGLLPLVRVTGVDPKGRASVAGLQENDVILRWGEYEYPTQKQITDSINKSIVPLDPDRSASWRTRLYDAWTWNPEKSIPVLVARVGEPKPLWREYRAKAGKKGRPANTGFRVNAIANNNLRISGVLETLHGRATPAAVAGIEKGAVIDEINGQPVANWHALAETFRVAAGQDVSLKYSKPDGSQVTTTFHVPQCLRTTMHLSTLSNIVSIDNQRFVTIQGRTRRAKISAGYSFGLYKILRQRLDDNDGQPTTVTVRYQETPYAEEQESLVTISEDTIDPWLGRIRYHPMVFMDLELQTLKASGPWDALMMGAKKTGYFVLQVYTMMERMIVSRSVGVENMAGPVGIVKMGSEVARVGFHRLLFFLAIISANLAVINFLPLPIMDGGLMVFLLVEKIKGSPVSLKVQVVTQVIGMFLIGAAFLFVTFNDVIRLAG